MRKSNKKNRHEVCHAIRELRHASGLTQQAFANRIGAAIRSVARWEAGGSPPRGEVLKTLADLGDEIGRPWLAEKFLKLHASTIEIDPFEAGSHRGQLREVRRLNGRVAAALVARWAKGERELQLWTAFSDALGLRKERSTAPEIRAQLDAALDLFLAQVSSTVGWKPEDWEDRWEWGEEEK
jgi:transcriptional regulator with XRE-family HTH domain